MATLGIIPARYASTRFPGKPLIDIAGKSMIQRVYEQACSSASLDKVVIATDDERIITEVKRFGGEYALTRSDHQSGTDRCAEVAEKFTGFEVIINIQGDEPYIDPVQIDLLSSCFTDPEVKLATLVKCIRDQEELFNQNIPKVVLNHRQQAIYFSRHTIPFLRNIDQENWLKTHQFYKHIGIYGYTADTLLQITRLKPSSLELAESLEQLRWIENGYEIQTRVTDMESIAVDTPEDLEKIMKMKGN
ncbi:3-deoxy-manno-octulosonate cytidylyltransferase (CMP-KDO synthetase) [Pedobacter westerhofensis]|uniref:3-deoxy-manno-octulosonate cytidylyltransferase n=1 Tax=Pedobacter westerhofensis TaxID=425512 RepID=A0A521BK31_9SPHI|nr:3-deoxy-manno-octulosonate cytidylyltransferase [Pedobacter westerhofensis]SMO47426.1 3-deoxy-manno-octulosonate cytidylyltransferase (CMP-KDO synthetase) [Pedobacter westerhofensis]